MDRIASPVAILAFINSASAILIWLPATAGSLQAGSQAARQSRMRFEPGSCARARIACHLRPTLLHAGTVKWGGAEALIGTFHFFPI
jgi:hypothetical protein